MKILFLITTFTFFSTNIGNHTPLFQKLNNTLVTAIRKLSPKLKLSKVIKYSKLIEKYSSKYKVNPEIVLTIIKTESNFDEKAISRTKDYGLMQINAKAHKMILLDPEKNLRFGIQLLQKLNTGRPCWFSRFHSNKVELRIKYEAAMANKTNRSRRSLCAL